MLKTTCYTVIRLDTKVYYYLNWMCEIFVTGKAKIVIKNLLCGFV